MFLIKNENLMNNDIQNEIEINDMHDPYTLFIVLLQLSESCPSKNIDEYRSLQDVFTSRRLE